MDLYFLRAFPLDGKILFFFFFNFFEKTIDFISLEWSLILV